MFYLNIHTGALDTHTHTQRKDFKKEGNSFHVYRILPIGVTRQRNKPIWIENTEEHANEKQNTGKKTNKTYRYTNKHEIKKKKK